MRNAITKLTFTLSLLMSLIFATAAMAQDELCVASYKRTRSEISGHSLMIYLDKNKGDVHVLETLQGHKRGQKALNRITSYFNYNSGGEFAAQCVPLNQTEEDRLDAFIAGTQLIKGRNLAGMVQDWHPFLYNCTHSIQDIFSFVMQQPLPIYDDVLGGPTNVVRPAALMRGIKLGGLGPDPLLQPSHLRQYVCTEMSKTASIRCN